MQVIEDYFELEGYKFLITGLDCKTYEDKWFRGIIYDLPNTRYDIFLNKVGWARIYITNKKPEIGEMIHKDIPLNDSTIKLLPDCIRVEKVSGK